MTKIDIYSDLHLDSWINNGYNAEDIKLMPTKGATFALFAGDGGNGPEWYARANRLLKSKYQKVISVPGNHCHIDNGNNYKGLIDLEHFDPSLQYYEVKDNGRVIKIVTATLWSNFRHSEINGKMAENAICDFGKWGIPGMTAGLMTTLCHDSFAYLANFAGQVDIVMTHFAPIRNSEHPLYASSAHLNPYFINDEPEFVEQMNAKLWVHGHTHKKFDYMFKTTRVVANPMGYCGEEQNQPIFIPKMVEI